MLISHKLSRIVSQSVETCLPQNLPDWSLMKILPRGGREGYSWSVTGGFENVGNRRPNGTVFNKYKTVEIQHKLRAGMVIHY